LGHKELAGRINAFAGDPANQQRVWAAPAVGGVFETDNGGASWHSIGDTLPTQAMSGLAYDAPLHRLLAGTGDFSFGADAIQGLGIFYSDNDGQTWTASSGLPDLTIVFKIQPAPGDPTGLTASAATSRGLFRSTDGGRSWTNAVLPTSPPGYTVPDPTRNNAQVSCAGNTTAPLCFFANIVTDVVVKSTGSLNAPAGAVMAVVGWRAGDAPDKNADGSDNTSCRLNGAPTTCIQAPRNGLYMSFDGGPGSFLYESHSGSPAGTDFAPDAVVGRTSLGIASGRGQNNDAVFALVQDAQKFQHCTDDVTDTDLAQVCDATVQGVAIGTVLDGAYASYDFGRTWTKIMNWSQLAKASGALAGQAGYGPGVQSWYNNWIEPDPTATDATGNPTRVIFGLEEVWANNPSVPGVLSTPWEVNANGVGPTASWVDIGRYWNACGGLNATGGVPCDTSGTPTVQATTTTHPDQHAHLFVPDGKGGVTLFAGNDGGAYKQHVPAGGDFTNQAWGDGIDVGLNTQQPYDAEVARDGTIVMGLQDNGEAKVAPSGKEMHSIFGGDGFYTAIDPNNSKNILEEYTYGAISMSLNGGRDWYSIGPNCSGNSQESQFATAFEQDPTVDGHVVAGCTQISEAGDGASTDFQGNPTKNPIWTKPCAVPPGADPFQCQLSNNPWTVVYDLGLASAPGQPVDRNTACNTQTCVFNIPSAVGVRGPNIYVGFCGYCDVVTGGLPFNSGIATNVGGSGQNAPQPGTSKGWHIAHAYCSGCGTANGLLPKRYITSIQQDPSNPKTVYVTMGGYGRRWIPPGAIGDSVANVGQGHVFVSHDAGEHFTDISGNLPDIPANWSLVHAGQLVVATDQGVYIAPTTAGGSWKRLGRDLPNAPVFTLRLQPGNPNRMIAATYGRGVWQYSF
ncbi:MAG TPA: sialidase family protein, partial [Acidimicrobiales bacterium]|nr:sialidase family protein [Acidimicrobiales bacterium]